MITKEQRKILLTMGFNYNGNKYNSSDVLYLLRILEFNSLYRRGYSLRRIGKTFDISGERVRQKLYEANDWGVILYPNKYDTKYGFGERYNKEYIEELVNRFTNIKHIAKELRLSFDECKNVLRFFDITAERARKLHIDRQKKEIIAIYTILCDRIGRKISITEMQKKRKLSLLRSRIQQLWKTWGNFKREMGIMDNERYFNGIMKVSGKRRSLKNILRVLLRFKEYNKYSKRYFTAKDLALAGFRKYGKWGHGVYDLLYKMRKGGYIDSHGRTGSLNKYQITNKGIQKCSKELNAVMHLENALKLEYRE